MNQQNPPKRILIVEDDKFLAGIFLSHLSQGEQWDVKLASTGEDGLKMMQSIKPDLVLLDLVLPGMDGYEMLQKAKADPELAAIPIVIVSNLGQRDEIAKGMNLGAKDFLVKADFDIDDIRGKIKVLLGN